VSAALDAVYRQTSDLGWTPERQAAVERLRRARAELVQRVRLRDPRWHALTEPVKADPALVDALLRRTGCAALDLFDLGDRVVTVLRDEQGGLVDSVPISSATRAAPAGLGGLGAVAEAPSRRTAIRRRIGGLAADAFVPPRCSPGRCGLGRW
jgi:hypothetical protein